MTELITQPESRGSLSDLRSQAMLAPVESIKAGLAEYADRRKAFRDWLRSQLIEGVHFGYPPGINPSDADPMRWKAKPSLYKAGADFVCDLMGIRCEFKADIDAWKQLGEPKGTFVMACYLLNKNGEIVGEGRGVRKVGDKKMQENASIKMAEKSAKVDAVLNAYALADLFSQDIGDPADGPEVHENPKQVECPQVVQPRGERVGMDSLTSLANAWIHIRIMRNEEATPLQYAAWASEITGIPHDKVRKPDQWNLRDFQRCNQWIIDNRGEE